MMEKLKLTDDEVQALRELAASGKTGNDYIRGMNAAKLRGGDTERAALRMIRNTWELVPLGGDAYELRRKQQKTAELTKQHKNREEAARSDSGLQKIGAGMQLPADSAPPETENEIKKKADAWDKLYDQTSKEAK